MKLSEVLSKPIKLKGRNKGVLDLRGFVKHIVDRELCEHNTDEDTNNEQTSDDNGEEPIQP